MNNMKKYIGVLSFRFYSICILLFVLSGFSIEAKDDNSELIRQIADACVSGSHEESDCNLLRQGAELFGLQELSELAVVLENKTLDVGDKHRIAATSSLLQWAEQKYGEGSFEAISCRRSYLAAISLTNLPKVREISKKNANLAKALAAKNPHNNQYKILELVSRLEYLNSFEPFGDDSPESWTEFWRVFKEVMPFLEDGKCEDPMLINICSLVSQLEANINNTAHYDYIGFLKDSVLQGQPTADIFKNNKYLKCAWEGSIKLRGRNHVQTLFQELELLAAQMRSKSSDYNTLHSRINEIQNLLTDYCPANDLQPVVAELLKWDSDIVYGQNLYELMSPFSVLHKIADFYGEESEIYLVYLIRIMNQQLVVNPQRAATLCLEAKDIAEKLHSKDSDEYGFYLLNMFYAMQSITANNPQRLQDYITQICDYYRNYHRPTWLSISIGKNLAINLANVLYQYELSSEIEDIAFNDLRKMVSNKSALYAFSLYDLTSSKVNIPDETIHSETEQSLKECIKLFKQHHLSSAHISENLARFLLLNHKGEEAISVLLQGIDNCIPGKDDSWRCQLQLYLAHYVYYHPSTSNSLISHQQLQELLDEAIPYYLQISEEHSGLFLEGYRIIGDIYRSQGRFPDAEKVYKQGIEYAESHIGETQSTEYIQLITSLCSLYHDLHDLDKAELLMEGKIEALEKDPYFDRHDLLLELMWNRYNLIKIKGDYLLRFMALTAIEQEIANIVQRSGYSDQVGFALWKPFIYEFCAHLDLWVTVSKNLYETEITDENSRLEIEFARNNFNNTIKLIRTEFPVLFNSIEENLKYNNPDFLDNDETFTLYSSIFNFYLAIENDTAKAESYMLRCLQSNNFMSRLRSTYRLGLLRIQQGKHQDASRLFEQVESMTEQIPNSMYGAVDKADLSARLFTSYYGEKEYEKAIKPARDIFLNQQLRIQKEFDFLTQSEREQFVSEQGGAGSTGLLLLLPHFPERLSGEGYNAVLAEKGLLLRSSERIKRSIQQSKDPKLIAQMDTLNRLNMALSTMNMNEKNPGEEFSYNPEVLELRQQIETLERNINRQAAKSISGMETPDWKQLQQALRPGEAAVEFVVLDSIGAIVLLPEGEPHYISLNQASNLWQELHGLSNSLANRKAKALYDEDRFHLYEKIWQPIEPLLNGVKTVYFSPTSFLNELVFSAFKCGVSEYLADRYDLHQMLSTGDLIELRKANNSSQPKSALLIGGVYYSPEHEQVATEWARNNEQRAIEDKRGAITEDNEEFGYLPFTRLEVNRLGKLLSNNHVNTQQGSGFEPTEESFRSLSNASPAIMHLSTHGFFVAGNDVGKNKYLSRFPMSMYSSMQRCGLVLADGNHTWDGAQDKPVDNDGIIAASEVALLDLSSTQLAVLSACQTAVGDYSQEGVYGMHRGFKQAGVKSILATMWNVNDQSTARFMELFYQRWLSGMPMQQSFNEAVKDLRKEYPSPYFWAPFVLMDAIN